MLKTKQIIQNRKLAAELIKKCVYEHYLVREALKQWPECKNDRTLLCAKHALIHFEVDDEIRKKNLEYLNLQIDWIENIIKILAKGDDIPINIIESYNEFYPIDISLRGKIIEFLTLYIYKIQNLLKRFIKNKKSN